MSSNGERAAVTESLTGTHSLKRSNLCIAGGRIVALIALWGLVVWGGVRLYVNSRLSALMRQGIAQASQAADNITRHVSRSILYYKGLPALLAENASVRAAAAHPPSRSAGTRGSAASTPIDALLARAARDFGADVVWIVDAAGICIASSNADDDESFVGISYAQREYFLEARDGRPGQQYAVGKKTGIPGLFFSAPVMIDGRFAGALVVKTNMSNLSFWVEQADALILDAYGVVVLAKDTSLEMRSVPGAAVDHLSLAARRERYGRDTFVPLSFGGSGDARFPSLLRVDGQPYPAAVLVRSMGREEMGVFVLARFPEIAALDGEFAWLFATLFLGGAALIAAVSGRIRYTRAELNAKRILAEQKSRLDEAQRIAKVGSWQWDIPSGRLEWTREANRIYAPPGSAHFSANYSGAIDGIRLGFFDAIHPDDRSAVEEAIKGALKSGSSFSIEHRLREGDLVLNLQGEVTRDESGRAVRMMATVQDISERKWFERELQRARDEAEAASLAKSEFLANMSHEIRTPMNGVLGMTELLQGTSLSPEQRDYVETIARSGDSLLTILNDILDLSKIEAGKLQLESIPFDLASLVFDVVELNRPKLRGGHIDLLVDIDPALPSRLVGDPSRLRQVLGNLMSNAVKFTSAGHVMVTAHHRSSDSVRVSFELAVADTGVGISEEAQRRLFQPFSQADASTSRRFGGSGLGLVLSRRIVEGMGGRIELQSAEGKGSTFTVLLQLPGAPGQPPAQRPPSILGSASVLVLDDNEVNRAILERQLGRLGVHVELARCGSDALEKARRAAREGHAFDAVLVDYHLPDMNGDEVGRVFREDPKMAELGLIMLSSSGQQGEAALMEAAGFDAYLVKPVRAEILASALAMVLERKRQGASGALITRHTVAEAGPTPKSDPVLTAPLHVLVAEDNPVNQKLAQKMLESLGATLEVAADGFQVLQAVERTTFDVVLMDCQMPGMDGFVATACIRERERARSGHLPIVAVTANALGGDREHCLAKGMDDYISKPITRQGLFTILSRWAAEAGTASGLAAPAELPKSEPAGAPTEGPALDEGHLHDMESLFDTEPGGFHAEMLQPYLSHTQGRLQDLERSLAQEDTSSAALIAHTIKGSSLNLGFVGMANRAGALEKAARQGKVKDPEVLAGALQDEFRRVTLFAEQYRKEAGKN
jgi:signal transduction histidine kinase/DNA-binding response OmpR family regulator/HPt (histidine-containing phosphotransfer) domain-containing protein